MKQRKLRLMSILVLMCFTSIFIVSCSENNDDSLIIFYTDDYIRGELIYTEPRVDDYIDVPIISNKAISDIVISDVEGVNIEDLSIEIYHIPTQNSFYEGFVYKNIRISIKAYEIYEQVKIESILFEISSEKKSINVSIPVNLTLNYDYNVYSLINFGSINMISLPPNLSLPNHFFSIRPSHNMEVLGFDNDVENSIDRIQVGISSTNQFNDRNTTDLETYNGNIININVLKNYNIYFYIDYVFENYNCLNFYFPLIWEIKLTNQEVYHVLVMNIINPIVDHITIRSYIDRNFLEASNE
ncbi:MAG: hypothetical protein RBT45_05270 [Acholeplasmataceae bacterium]|nr:hypothetical protein [Acholeplasmataceae bacterium]